MRARFPQPYDVDAVWVEVLGWATSMAAIVFFRCGDVALRVATWLQDRMRKP